MMAKHLTKQGPATFFTLGRIPRLQEAKEAHDLQLKIERATMDRIQ